MPQPPRVTDLQWGSVQTESGTFRDAKLWPDGARGWDWTETGTHHRPGIQPADLDDLLDGGAETVVLGIGQQRRLGVTDEALEALDAAGVPVEVLESRQAVGRYNELAERGDAVGALIHSTC